MKKSAAASAAVLFALLIGAVVHAEPLSPPFDVHNFGTSLASAITEEHVSDLISQIDANIYAESGIGQKFGITFRPHARVCSPAQAGEVACDARVITNGHGSAVTNSQPVGYGPAQLLNAYGLVGIASGTPVVAVVDAYDDPNIAKDLAAYSKTFGVPALPTCSGPIASSPVPCFQKMNEFGSTISFPRSNAGWALETSLDVETVHAVCQNCRILLVEANSSSYNDLMMAVNRAVSSGASIVSNSYGSNEFSSESSFDSHFNHPGVAFTFSAGDSGYGVEYPAASPYVTAVGGTSLFLNGNGTYNTESAWSGTGSGCSAYENKPSWQTDTGCSKRTVADVSADADPNTGAAVYDSLGYSGVRGWFEVGGTSLASPIVAATYALSGNVPAGVRENSLPYNVVPASLHDVMSGSNGSCGGSYLCLAGSGYDGPTGLGTPLGATSF